MSRGPGYILNIMLIFITFAAYSFDLIPFQPALMLMLTLIGYGIVGIEYGVYND